LSLPQLLIALAGGLMARQIFKRGELGPPVRDRWTPAGPTLRTPCPRSPVFVHLVAASLVGRTRWKQSPALTANLSTSSRVFGLSLR
jgi:hypothetical protein